MADVARIWIKRAHRGPMDSVEVAEAVEGRGLADSADQGGRRQVSLLSSQRWAELMAEVKADLDPSARRANILLEGVDLLESRGKRLLIGEVELLIAGETRPCERMDEAHPGLQLAMKARWGGGIHAEVTRGGTIRTGDSVTLLASS